jgi:signal transduction histidine kinase
VPKAERSRLRPLPAPPIQDVLIALALAAAAELEVWLADIPGPRGVSAAGAILVAAPLAWRRRAPLVAAILVVGLQAVEFHLGVPSKAPALPALMIIVAMYSLGSWGDTRGAWIGGAFALTAVWSVVLTQTPVDVTDLPWTAAFTLLPLILGRALRLTKRDAAVASDRAAQAERDRDRATREAIADERARIARELHDVVSHSISVMGVQAGAVRRLLPPGNEELGETLHSVEESGRDALGEMRRLLGIVREGAEPPSLAPQPGIGSLDELAEQTRAAGTDVELRIEGDDRPLPPGLDLTVYRIVQEALTNVRKHAGSADVVVSLTRDRSDLELVITDDGPGADEAADGGHGIIGMRERVGLYGGDLSVGRPVSGVGHEVRAHLPLDGQLG